MAKLECLVEAGAAYLDAKEPGWRKLIDEEKLSLANGNSCILGQIYGDFDEACKDWLHITPEVAYALGFHINPSGGYQPRSKRWKPLTEAWKNELKKGREKKRA